MFFHSRNKELFENAPPYMIIRPYLKGGLYIHSGQIPILIDKLTYIYEPPLTKPYEYYDKSVSYHILHLFTNPYEHGDSSE